MFIAIAFVSGRSLNDRVRMVKLFMTATNRQETVLVRLRTRVSVKCLESLTGWIAYGENLVCRFELFEQSTCPAGYLRMLVPGQVLQRLPDSNLAVGMDHHERI